MIYVVEEYTTYVSAEWAWTWGGITDRFETENEPEFCTFKTEEEARAYWNEYGYGKTYYCTPEDCTPDDPEIGIFYALLTAYKDEDSLWDGEFILLERSHGELTADDIEKMFPDYKFESED